MAYGLARSKSRRQRVLLALLVMMAAVSTGCSTGAAPSRSTTAAPSGGGEGSPGGSVAEPSGQQALPAPEVGTIRIGLSITQPHQFAAKLAEMEGIYQKNGFANAEVTVFEGDGKAMQALQAGQIDVALAGVSPAISSQATDAPAVVLAVNAVVLTENLVSAGSIKTADDIRGKRIAISTFGGTSHGEALLAVEALGLTPQDVVITQVGRQEQRIAALLAGSVEAAIIESGLNEQMVAQGFNILVDLEKEGVQWGRSATVVTEEWLAANPQAALVATASILEAQNLFWTEPDLVAQRYAEFNQVTIDEARKLVADFQRIGNRSMTWNEEAFENPKTTLAAVNPDITGIPVADAYDRSILEKLKAMGFYEKIGSPAP